jgi:cellulose synthase/poly-beta-1,6-N-acetylglucosamine synthase-like glycosyltransferase
MVELLSLIYRMAYLGLGLYGLHATCLVLIFLWHRNRAGPMPSPPPTWPSVTVQLPIYNEPFMVSGLIHAVCGLDYPREALSIQVLDDSTDGTTEIARRLVRVYRRQGFDICLIHRDHRRGYKAGALAEGTQVARGEYIAVLDADFLPQSDFLKRIIPYLTADPEMGMAQARWGHLNAGQNPFTRGQALSLDGQLVVVQIARDRVGLLVKFNGSAGVWRRSCIEDAGGWEGDTLTEDLDLSIRAQMRGWRLAYIPEIVVPAQIPPRLMDFKRQQYRWAYGSVQALLKLGGALWRSPLPLGARIEGLIHMGSYFANPLAMILVLASLPLLLMPDQPFPGLPGIWILGLGAPALFALSQKYAYPDWGKRLAYLPLLVLMGLGLALSNTLAVFSALFRRPTAFERTPKFRGDGLEMNQPTTDREAREDGLIQGGGMGGSSGSLASSRAIWTIRGELFMGVYAFFAASLAWGNLHRLSFALAAIALGYSLMAVTGLRHYRTKPLSLK